MDRTLRNVAVPKTSCAGLKVLAFVKHACSALQARLQAFPGHELRTGLLGLEQSSSNSPSNNPYHGVSFWLHGNALLGVKTSGAGRMMRSFFCSFSDL